MEGSAIIKNELADFIFWTYVLINLFFGGEGRISRFIQASPLFIILDIVLVAFFTRYGIQLLVSKKQWEPRYDVYIRPRLWKVYVKLTSMVYLIFGSYTLVLAVYAFIWSHEIYLEEIPFWGFYFAPFYFAIFIWIGLKIVGFSLFVREHIQHCRKNKDSKDDYDV